MEPKKQLLLKRLKEISSKGLVDDEEFKNLLKVAVNRLEFLVKSDLCEHQEVSGIHYPTPYGVIKVTKCTNFLKIVNKELH